MIAEFENYLIKKGFKKESLKSYRSDVRKFILYHPNAKNYTYQDIINYLGSLDVKASHSSKRRVLSAIKRYYDFLIEAGIRKNHPCKTISIKGNTKNGIIFQDLFSMPELESLLERDEKWEHMRIRNQVVISLLIYQGLIPSEIIALKLHQIDLDLGKIRIPPVTLSSRTLELHPKQYRLLDKYIHEARKRLLFRGENEYLILNYQGRNDNSRDGVLYLIETMKGRFQDRNLTTKAIRDSVISYWLNEMKLPLEQVQLMAGHKWISSTLRFRQSPINDQRDILNKFHPLG